MIAPDEVATMIRLKALGWGVRRIARELGCSHMTVRRYLEAGGWIAYRRPQRATRLAGLEAWLAERFRRHRGNADVVRQELGASMREILVPAITHSSADVHAREADIIQDRIVHCPQLPEVAPDAHLLGNRRREPCRKPGHDTDDPVHPGR